MLQRHQSFWSLVFAAVLVSRVGLSSGDSNNLDNSSTAGQFNATCPPVGSLFDLPDLNQCKRQLSHLRDCRQLPDATCCALLATFATQRCHCWRQFRQAQVVTALRRMHMRCSEPAQQEQQQRWQQQKQQQAAEVGSLTDSAAGAQGSHHPAPAEAPDPQAVRLFVGVLSASKNAEARQAIRDTWGSHSLLHRLLFFAAKPRDEALFDALRREAMDKGDLVILPYIWEGYFNITHQTFELCRAAALDPKVTHVLKADDDSYVRVQRLVGRIRSLPPTRTFLGYIEDPGGGPHRDPGNQWYVSKEEWGSEVYPPWAHGAGYVLTVDLVREIAAGAALKPGNHRIFKLEDVAMGSWLEFISKEHGWKLTYITDKRFNFYGCNSLDFVSHYMNPSKMRCTWANHGHCCASLNRQARRKDMLRGKLREQQQQRRQ